MKTKTESHNKIVLLESLNVIDESLSFVAEMIPTFKYSTKEVLSLFQQEKV